MGGTGLTAYFGLFRVGQPNLKCCPCVWSGGCHGFNCRSAHAARWVSRRWHRGGQEKCDWLIHELGFDDAIDYKAAGQSGCACRLPR